MSATLSAEALDLYRQRRAAGASVKSLAEELGIPWQRLDKALRHGIAGRAALVVEPPPVPEDTGPVEPERAVLPEPALQGPGLLIEKYRPTRLRTIFGQPQIVRRLQAFARAPYPAAFLFTGETGTGKTSAALALAAELGCDLEQKDFGGVQMLASGEQSAEAVRECCARMWLSPMCGSGWKVFILNEAERMHVQAETIWLDRLENIPPKTVVVFTSNHAAKLSPRFRDRCVHLPFQSGAKRLHESARTLLTKVWRAETGKPPRSQIVEQVVTEATVAGQLSFRRAVQLLQAYLPPKRESRRKR